MLSALSLLLPARPTYDPWAWLVWSRELAHGSLSTVAGPSWKPLPVLLTTPFSLLGDRPAETAWLVMSRAGGLAAIALTFQLATRLAGRWAGLLAATALLLADGFVRDVARANSEGLLVALVLGAVELHLRGRRHGVYVLLVGASLLRPEIWPILLAYGLFLLLRVPRSRLLVLAGLVAVAVLWLGPEYVGSGNALRASDRARQPNPDSSAFAAVPALDVLRRSAGVLILPVLLAAAAGVVLAVRSRRRLALGLTALAAGLLLLVAAMTQAGYAGNLRYVALPAAVVCALAAGAAVALARRSVVLAVLAGLVTAPFAALAAGEVADDLRVVSAESALLDDLALAVDAAGGREAVLACGPLVTTPFETTALAFALQTRIGQVGIFPSGEGTVLAPRPGAAVVVDPLEVAGDPRYELVARTDQWVVRRSCP